MEKKCIVLFSGGLDSRLAVKLMQKQGFDVVAVFFKLPFGCGCLQDVKEFAKEQRIKLKIFDQSSDLKELKILNFCCSFYDYTSLIFKLI